jgi:hypothetical protein
VTLAGALAVTAVVWAVSLVRSVRLRALVYSLPLPMSLALLAGDGRVDGAQVLGVGLLVGFFAVVAAVHERLGGHILLADAAGVLGYVGGAALVARAGPIPLLPALAAAGPAWLAVVLAARAGAGRAAARPAPRADEPGVRRPGAVLGRLVLVLCAALLMVPLGGVLSGLVVTFPYAGVLVAVEARRHLGDFTRHVARTSLALVAFLAGYGLARDWSAGPGGVWAGLAAGWAAFALTAAALHADRWTRQRATPVGGGP